MAFRRNCGVDRKPKGDRIMVSLATAFPGGFKAKPPQKSAYVSMTDPRAAFVDHLRECGYLPPTFLSRTDISRFPAPGDKPQGDAGWAVYYEFPDTFNPGGNIGVGVYGDWRTGERETWVSKRAESMSHEERTALSGHIEEAKRLREEAQAKLHAETAIMARAEWETLQPATAHSYLDAKRIKPHGARIKGDALVVPVCDASGIVSLQYIWTDKKRFMTGGKTRGCYYIIPGANEPNGSNTVYVCEGFATGATIAEATGATVYVAFNAGNLIDVTQAAKAAHPQARLIVAGDDDVNTEGNPGRAKATAAADMARCDIVFPDVPTDFNDMACAGHDVAAELVQVVGHEGPQPLVREIPTGEPYPVHALGPLRAAVEAVQGMTQAPVAIPAQSALAVASLAVQGFADVETLGGARPISLYALTVARSGERKSACDAPFMDGLRAHEREQAKARRETTLAWTNSHAIWKGERDRILAQAKRGNGEKRIAARADLEELGPEPEAPPSADRTVTEPTFEGLTKLFAFGQPSLGLFSDEGGQFLGGHAMNSENRQKTLAAFNDLWQGNPIRRTRAGDGHATLFGRRLAVHLMVQPTVARGFMADPLAADTGFLPRFLICEPPSAIGTRMQANARRDDTELEIFATRMREILDTPLPMDPETRELQPRTLQLTHEARALLVDFSDTIEAAQAPGGTFAHITGTASKAAEQAARIAGVLTLWHDLDAQKVEADGMADAIELAQFYLSEASRLASAATVSAEIDRAEALRRWLLESWQYENVMARDVVQLGPNQLRETPKARAALGILEKHGWLTPLEAGTVVRGAARKEVWRLVRERGGVV
ncbi:MAG: hypothetical protein CMI61_04260 [Parvibaculum sp.]|jgi:hypothetical protein|nr:hypothetical protein [Parvibaculum sp.]